MSIFPIIGAIVVGLAITFIPCIYLIEPDTFSKKKKKEEQ